MDNSLNDTDMVIDRRIHELPLIHLPPIHSFLLLSNIRFLIWNYSLRKKSGDFRLWIGTRNYVPIGFRKGLSLSSKISVCKFSPGS